MELCNTYPKHETVLSKNINLFFMTQFFCKQFLPPATKLRQGNIFTSMCQEFCLQWGVCCRGMCMAGACIVGGMHGRGACMVGACVAGGAVWQGGGLCGRGCAWWQWGMHCRVVHGRGICVVEGFPGRGRHTWQKKTANCSGRYASYLNVFLLSLKLLHKKLSVQKQMSVSLQG